MKLGVVGYAERGQEHAVQRHHLRGCAGGELPLLHHRAEHGRGGRAGRAAGRAGGDVPPGEVHPGDAGVCGHCRPGARAPATGEGLGNKFLSHIREVDAIVHVVRCFEDENVIHVDGSVDPARDIDTINTELILADIETVAEARG